MDFHLDVVAKTLPLLQSRFKVVEGIGGGEEGEFELDIDIYCTLHFTKKRGRKKILRRKRQIIETC